MISNIHVESVRTGVHDHHLKVGRRGGGVGEGGRGGDGRPGGSGEEGMRRGVGGEVESHQVKYTCMRVESKLWDCLTVKQRTCITVYMYTCTCSSPTRCSSFFA